MEAGWVVRDSHFESCGAAVFVGGGRQTTVENNTFINCTLPVSVRYNCTCTFGLATPFVVTQNEATQTMAAAKPLRASPPRSSRSWRRWIS